MEGSPKSPRKSPNPTEKGSKHSLSIKADTKRNIANKTKDGEKVVYKLLIVNYQAKTKPKLCTYMYTTK